nr:restriction endonuclease [Bacteroidales bacterium]
DNQNIERSLDEVTCMKILPRIEGDEEKTSKVLAELEIVLKEQLADFWGDGFDENKSISLKKIKEMKNRLKSGYTSFWS